MRHCSACGQQLPDDTGTCPSCTAAAGQSCPACSEFVPARNRFCGQCGARMGERQPAARAPQQIEMLPLTPGTLAPRAAADETLSLRREVTVLFLDLTNF